MREKEKSTTIYYVRHGQPDFPIDRIYCDAKEDPSLTPEGQRQAESAAAFFKGSDIAAIYASPSLRTRMTAVPFAALLGHEVQYKEDLRERRFGIWEGLYFSEIEQSYPEQYQAWKANQVEYTPEGGESMDVLFGRLQRGIGEIVATHPGQSVVVVTHVGPIRALVVSAFEMPRNQFRQIKIDYASITTIDYGTTKNNLINLNIVRY